MNQLKRYYNQNRKKIWGIIIIIAFAFAILQLANFFAKRQNEQAIQKAVTQQRVADNTVNTIDGTNTSQSSSNTQASKSSTETDTIKQFVSYCNKKDLENAYNMLTNECKEQMFSDIETFERIYYNSAFENKAKDAVINNWSNHTYLVYLRESALSTGKVSDENQNGDYITVVKDDESNYKLNINSYIGYKGINKTKDENNIKMEVLNKNTYMNYEEYTIKVTNNNNNIIILDSLYNAETIYIEDSNGTKFPSYNHELSKDLLTISGGHTRELRIKFYSSYSSSKKIKKLVFSDMRIETEKIKYNVEL